jgi:hypothetical protein
MCLVNRCSNFFYLNFVRYRPHILHRCRVGNCRHNKTYFTFPDKLVSDRYRYDFPLFDISHAVPSTQSYLWPSDEKLNLAATSVCLTLQEVPERDLYNMFGPLSDDVASTSEVRTAVMSLVLMTRNGDEKMS